MSKPSNKNQMSKTVTPNQIRPKSANPFVGAMMGQLAALLSFGGTFGIPSRFKPKVLVKKKCLNCGTTHHHSNAYCSTYCCHAWREENPQRGKANHYFGEFNQACRTIDGFEQVLS